jgi:hypothetical protein
MGWNTGILQPRTGQEVYARTLLGREVVIFFMRIKVVESPEMSR